MYCPDLDFIFYSSPLKFVFRVEKIEVKISSANAQMLKHSVLISYILNMQGQERVGWPNFFHSQSQTFSQEPISFLINTE